MSTPEDWQTQPKLNKRFWVGCAILMFCVMFAAASLFQVRETRTFAANNIPALATVVQTREVEEIHRQSGKPDYFITYRFSFGDQTFTQERDVKRPFFEDHPVGTSWLIMVYPPRPDLHEIYPGEKRHETWGFVFGTLFFLAGGLVLTLGNGNLTVLRARLR